MELQDRQDYFKSRGAALFVLGSKPETVDMAKEKVTEHRITYPILYDADTSVARKVSLWSDRMDMPFMGYVVIDKAGRVAAADQVLSEAKGAAPKNISEILNALDGTRKAAAVP